MPLSFVKDLKLLLF